MKEENTSPENQIKETWSSVTEDYFKVELNENESARVERATFQESQASRTSFVLGEPL